jgi:FkbM family methyltransferase
MNLDPIKKYFTPTAVLDIGANAGWFYNISKQTFPDANHCLIDANPKCESYLRALGVEYYICVLSDTIKIVDFYTNTVSDASTGASIYRENTEWFSNDKVIINQYETTTLDLLFPDRQFDLIKMDIQGSELDVIRGGPRIISKAKGLILELSSINYNEGSPLELEVVEYVKTIGFEKVDVLDGKSTERPYHHDALFLNKNL